MRHILVLVALGAMLALIAPDRLVTAQGKDDKEAALPFKPETYPGRKAKSDRVVVMELFTGAQCPPCVAADVAFDGLEKTYKPSEMALIQYHLHIPGPDPLTNADTVARAKYYKCNSTPTSIFNGTPKARGGGGMAASKAKYDQYRAVIDPLLETSAMCQVSAAAKRKGDRISIDTAVTGLAEAGKDLKLRLVLVEEMVRYTGGNQLRLHHHVVRAMPGGVDGIAIPEKAFKNHQEISIDELRKTLTSYLDQYARIRPFPRPDRPMEMQELHVIAFVQNDATQEILQAAQVDVTD